MTITSLGAKRTCPSCAAKFYDLGKMPAQCPKCSHKFDPTVVLRARRRGGRATAESDAAKDALKIKAEIKKPKVSKLIDGVDLEGFEELEVEAEEDIEEMEEMDDIDVIEDIEKIDSSPDEPMDDDIIMENGDDNLVDTIEEDIEEEEDDPKPKKKLKK